jgi:hypothetical protein
LGLAPAFSFMKYYEHIELSFEETVQAIEEARKKKYFHEKNKPYWQEKQRLAAEDQENEKISRRKKPQTIPTL